MASPTLQFKRGAFVNLPGLRAGEPGFTTDKYDLYVGLTSSTETNQFFGSARYWTRENGTDAAEFKFVDKNGTNGVSLRAPATVGSAVTYTLPEGGGTTGHFLQLGANGVLEWATVTDNASFDDATLNNTSFTGVSTFSGLINATAGALFNEIEVTGIATVGSLYVGIDEVLYDDLGTLTLANIEAIDSITKATLEATLALDPNDFDSLNVSGIGTIEGLLDAQGGLNVDGLSELDTVNVSVAATFASATVSDLTAGRVVLAGTGGELEDSANLTFGAGGLTVGANGINVTGVSTFSTDVVVGGDLEVTGNDIKSSSATAITLSGSDVEVKGDLQVTGNDIKASDGATNITMTSSTLTAFAGDIKVGGNDIQASDGVTAITLSAVTGNVGVSSDLTVAGNLYVQGTTTEINTTSLTVEDRTVELGRVGGAVPSAETTWDLGVLFNYHDGVDAQKSAVIWEHGDGRFKFAKVLDADTEGTTVNTPQLGITGADNYAAIEINALWINDCAGSSQVISCADGERKLENITLDGGVF